MRLTAVVQAALCMQACSHAPFAQLSLGSCGVLRAAGCAQREACSWADLSGEAGCPKALPTFLGHPLIGVGSWRTVFPRSWGVAGLSSLRSWRSAAELILCLTEDPPLLTNTKTVMILLPACRQQMGKRLMAC